MDKGFERRIVKQVYLEWRSSGQPIDRVVNETLREHRIGSQQRATIAQALYNLMRFRPLLVPLPEKPENPTWMRDFESRIDAAFVTPDVLRARHETEKPTLTENPRKHFMKLHGLPDFLVDEILASNPVAWNEYLGQMMSEAPMTVRLNPLRADVDALLKRWEPMQPQESPWTPGCFYFSKRWAAIQDPAYLDGQFEIQDEHSQWVSILAEPKPGEMVLDMCAGAGGKSLHLATLMANKGEVWCYDIGKKKLAELATRARRAGLTNVRVLEHLPRGKKFDVVLVDAPCSGLGTLRRGPDRLYLFDRQEAARLADIQAELVELATGFLNPGGRLLYATCTVRPAENEAIARRLFEKHGRKPVDVAAVVARSLGEKAATFLATARSSSAARIGQGLLPDEWSRALLHLGPTDASPDSSHSSGRLVGDGFFAALVN